MENGTFYNENKANRVRRIKIAAVIFVTFFLQNNQLFIFRSSSVPLMLLVPLTVCVGMFERELWGMIFGLFAGVMLDAFSAESLCFHSIALTCIGFVSGLLITGIFRNNLKTCFIFSLTALVIYNTLYFLIFYASQAVLSKEYVFVNIYLASVIYTLFFTVIFYIIIRSISSKKKSE